jgi:hypothetical protein
VLQEHKDLKVFKAHPELQVQPGLREYLEFKDPQG